MSLSIRYRIILVLIIGLVVWMSADVIVARVLTGRIFELITTGVSENEITAENIETTVVQWTNRLQVGFLIFRIFVIVTYVVYVGVFLEYIFLRPMKSLTRHLDLFAKGDFSSRPVFGSSPEWNALSGGYADTAESLEDARLVNTVLSENLAQHIFFKDGESRYISANDAFCTLSGVTTESIVGLNDFDMYPKELAERYRKDDRFVMDNRTNIDVEEPFTSPDGKELWVRTVKTPVYNPDGSMRGVMGIFRDITDMRDRESELKKVNRDLEHSLDKLAAAQEQIIESEKLAALGGLVAGIAHEISTPLGVAVTASSYLTDRSRELRDLARKESVEEKKSPVEEKLGEIAELTEMIDKNLKRASETIKSFKRMAVDQSSGVINTFDLREYLHDVVTSIWPRFKKTHHRVDIRGESTLKVRANPGHYSQVFTNLIINSLVHGFKGVEEGVVVIDLGRDDDEVVIEYSDNGIGMTPDIRTRIFEPFFTTDRDGGGSGLGLNIVETIIKEKLGGRFHLQTAPGEGFHLTIRIPKEADPEESLVEEF